MATKRYSVGKDWVQITFNGEICIVQNNEKSVVEVTHVLKGITPNENTHGMYVYPYQTYEYTWGKNNLWARCISKGIATITVVTNAIDEDEPDDISNVEYNIGFANPTKVGSVTVPDNTNMALINPVEIDTITLGKNANLYLIGE